MAALGWGDGGWGDFGWGGEDSGAIYSYAGDISLSLTPSSINKTTAKPVTNIDLTFTPEAIIERAQVGTIELTLEPSNDNSAIFSYEGALTCSLNVSSDNSTIAVPADLNIDLALTISGLVAIKPYIDGVDIVLTNSAESYVEYCPITNIPLSILSSEESYADYISALDGSMFVILPNSYVFGWRETQRETLAFNEVNRDTLLWTEIDRESNNFVEVTR